MSESVVSKYTFSTVCAISQRMSSIHHILQGSPNQTQSRFWRGGTKAMIKPATVRTIPQAVAIEKKTTSRVFTPEWRTGSTRLRNG